MGLWKKLHDKYLRCGSGACERCCGRRSGDLGQRERLLYVKWKYLFDRVGLMGRWLFGVMLTVIQFRVDGFAKQRPKARPPIYWRITLWGERRETTFQSELCTRRQ